MCVGLTAGVVLDKGTVEGTASTGALEGEFDRIALSDGLIE
jgi:hypothetical protein